MGWMLVLSRLKSCRQEIRHMAEISGMYFSSCSLVSSGVRPFSPISEAMVPPVPISRIFFFSILLSSRYPRSRPSRAASPKRTARAICSLAASSEAASYRARSSRRNRPRRGSSSARAQRLWAGLVLSRSSRA